jgi:hypothetical protein
VGQKKHRDQRAFFEIRAWPILPDICRLFLVATRFWRARVNPGDDEILFSNGSCEKKPHFGAPYLLPKRDPLL